MTTFTTPTTHDRPAGAHFAEPGPRHRAVLARGGWRRVTRRIVCGLACALTVSSLLMPSVSLAAEWIDVGGSTHNAADGAAGDGSTWSWDGADDLQLNGYNGGGIIAGGKLNVSYEGDNNIASMGEGITAIEISLDGGKTWVSYDIEGGSDPNKWTYWYFTWTPEVEGAYTISARAVTETGRTQSEWQTIMFNAKDVVD